MFRRRSETDDSPVAPAPVERVTSVLGAGTIWGGRLSGSGGVRIEGAFEGDIDLRGLLVIGETGRVTCEHLRADVVIVAGVVKGNITAEKLEIRATGRVWGDVVTTAFATEEGAFLRGQIRMEEELELEAGSDQAAVPADTPPETSESAPEEETEEPPKKPPRKSSRKTPKKTPDKTPEAASDTAPDEGDVKD